MNSALRGFSLCQSLYHKLDQMTQRREKGPKYFYYCFKMSDFITATSFKIILLVGDKMLEENGIRV